MPGAATVPEPIGRYADAGGVKLHYHEFGADRPGVPIVCLHGAGPGATAWSNFHGNVDAFAEHSRTLLVDLPQFGRSEKVVIEGGRQSFSANVLAEFLKALAIPEADFVGNSMGGGGTWWIGGRYPERFAAIAPAHPTGFLGVIMVEVVR